MKLKANNIIKKSYAISVAQLTKRPLLTTLVGAVVFTLVGAVIFYLRYPFAFDSPNFYAEDGQIFITNLLEKGPIAAALSGFNGYLILGQYVVGYGGIIINGLVGGDFVTLAKSLAVSSYLFLGFICVLPWLLFRKKLGTILSVITVLALWLTPLGTYDSAVIGTIGNLKFSFLFIATLLVIFRNDRMLCNKPWKFVLVDVALLICLATNIVVLALIPFILIRYIPEIKQLFKKRQWSQFASFDFISVIAVAIISFAYLVVVYLMGVPEISGYLDGPLHSAALTAIAYRSSTYALTFPVNYLFNDAFALITMVAFAVFLFFKRRNLGFAVVIAVALVVNVVAFVINRPGVTEFYLTYHDGWPGHFFYAGTMIVVFALAYLLAEPFNSLGQRYKFGFFIVAVFCLALFLQATSLTKSDPYVQGTVRSTLPYQVEQICQKQTQVGDDVWIELYPSPGWNMKIEREEVCN